MSVMNKSEQVVLDTMIVKGVQAVRDYNIDNDLYKHCKASNSPSDVTETFHMASLRSLTKVCTICDLVRDLGFMDYNEFHKLIEEKAKATK